MYAVTGLWIHPEEDVLPSQSHALKRNMFRAFFYCEEVKAVT